MNPAEFLTRKKAGQYCGYLNTTFKEQKEVFFCGNPDPRELKDVYFPEPCTGETWNGCPLNCKVSRETLERIAKGNEPVPGESWEIELPPELAQSGQRYVVENKDGIIKFHKITIYQRVINKPPKTVIEEVL